MDTIHIIVDTREHDFYTIIKEQYQTYSNISIHQKQLEIGDIVIKYQDIVLCIVERKTISDLLASLKDGRYAEQSFRLSHASNISQHKIIYLIEGQMSKNALHKKQIYSSIVSLHLFKGFSVYKTLHVKESVDYILHMALKLKTNIDKKKNLWSHIQPQEPQEPQKYSEIVSSCKIKNITIDNINQIMLSQIPAIGPTISHAICNKYKNIRTLLQIIDNEPQTLSQFTYEVNGKKRKLSKTAVSNIVHYLQ